VIKIKELVPVKEQDRPLDSYELILTFSAKNHTDIVESFFFKYTDELTRSISLLLEYFKVPYNTRCGVELYEVVSDERKQEVATLDYENLTEYQDFCSFLKDYWPQDANWIPRMLDSFEVYYYDASSSKFKVIFE
jgi:hypothetical protein